MKGVLELEAEVQNDPSSWEAWYALGLKQQENEREEQAILALSKVIQLEPDHRDTYLALAVSYTNEGQKEAANTMLERWIDLAQEERRDGEMNGGSYEERRGRIVERLIDMARANPDDVDPDVQIALGVMFNASEVSRVAAKTSKLMTGL
jgi:peroxin-5